MQIFLISNELYHQQMQKQCLVCTAEHPKALEIAYIFKQALYQMKQAQHSLEQIEQMDFKSSSFCQLLKILIGEIQDQISPLIDCPHSKLVNYFCKNLNCTETYLLKLSQEFCIKIVKRKYELEVVKNMMRSIPNTIHLNRGFFTKNQGNIKYSKNEQKKQIEQKFNFIQQKPLKKQLKNNKSQKEHFSQKPMKQEHQIQNNLQKPSNQQNYNNQQGFINQQLINNQQFLQFPQYNNNYGYYYYFPPS